MKINLKLCLLALTLVLSGQSLNACNPLPDEDSICRLRNTLGKEVELTAALKKGLEEHKFDAFIVALKTGTTLNIAGTDYFVCPELPKLYSRIHEEEVPTNPCYTESSGIGPKLLTPARLEYLPADDPFVSFYLCGLITSPDADYITLSFTTDYNPHWQSVFSSPVPMDKRYWSEDHTASWVPLRYVSFLLQKRS